MDYAKALALILLWLSASYLPTGANLQAGECNAEEGECPARFTSSGPWLLSTGGLEVELRQDGEALTWGKVSWAGGVECEDTLALGPLFALKVQGGGTVTSEKCKLNEAPSLDAAGKKLTAALACPNGINVDWSAEIEDLGAGLGAALRLAVAFSSLRILHLAGLLLKDSVFCAVPSSTGTVDGSPVSAGGGRWIFGMEHPLAKSMLSGSGRSWGRYSAVSVLTHLGELPKHTESNRRYGTVVVAVAEPSQARRTFAKYLHWARPQDAWQGPLVHYNSWYDFTSWQDEGFFRAPEYTELLQTLRKEPMNEAGCLMRIEAFEELTRRGVKLDSFLWDDGWDDPRALWSFDRKKFPNGFTAVAARAQQIGAGLSVWLSPWGGYGDAQKERLRLGRKQGFETNEHGFSLAGSKYSARFKAAVLDFRKTYRVNMFKFDGVAGDPSELSGEIEAMLSIVSAIRTESQEQSNNTGSKDSFWINLTTGTWPSPFFLLWVDSIWRGLLDTSVPNWSSVKGLTVRQKWQVWRECVVHERVARQAILFPLSRLMVHGAVLAGHGDALANGLHMFDENDWAQEVWSLAAMGLQLQELYISAKFMKPWAWDELAAALKWAKEEWEVLQDAHWGVEAECALAQKAKKFRPYSMAAYKGNTTGGLGFMMMRNPRNKAQAMPSFSMAQVLELPAADKGKELSLRVVRRTSKANPTGTELDCANMGETVRAGDEHSCIVPANAHITFKMDPGELAVLRADLLRNTAL